MKKTLLFLLALLGCLGAQADQKRVIRVATDQTDLLLQVGDNGRLYQTYLGPKLRHEADLQLFDWYVMAGSDGAISRRGWEAYAGGGGEDYFEPALTVLHNDGNPST